MKKLLSIVMAAILMISATAYAEPSGQQTQTPAGETIEEKLYQMIPVFDSLTRSMGIEGEVAYDAKDPQFIWTQLMLLGSNWGFSNTRATYINGNQIILTASMMQEYAAASFYGVSILPEIPGNVAGVSLDAGSNSYRLTMSGMTDVGQSYILIERYALNADGSLLVGIGLYDSYLLANATRLGGLTVQVTGYSYQGTASDLAFPYSVKNVQAEADTDFDGLDVTDCNIRHINELYQIAPTPAPTDSPSPTPTFEPEATSTPVLSEYSRLSLGESGESVRELQERLEELGYECGSIDGVFGSNTKRAVRYFQDAIGAHQDGVATSSLQKKLFASGAPEYVTYVQLKKGAEGIRVEKLQTRLRELRYLAEPVDGEFGARTVDAVKLFQKKAGLTADGVAGTRTLKALFKKDAPKCDEYITLKSGDSGSRVKEMQTRLHQLGFLVKEANSRYDADTVKAVQAFMKAIGIEADGKTADKALQEKLFAYTPPTPTPGPTATPSPTPVLTPTPTPAPVQTITNEQLNTFTTDVSTLLATQCGSADAVRWLQQRLNLPLNGVYDEATKSAVSAYQTSNGLPATGIADMETLKKF